MLQINCATWAGPWFGRPRAITLACNAALELSDHAGKNLAVHVPAIVCYTLGPSASSTRVSGVISREDLRPGFGGLDRASPATAGTDAPGAREVCCREPGRCYGPRTPLGLARPPSLRVGHPDLNTG